ncbi:hypothetical protein C7H19_06355 [Aphanothece hegewaldii CCALA 016]|uniref:Bacterial cell division membrane protein n=1 Tax=Aphanothece hegewaldii CCALA 016 TaxID=2107694 RepID=A0A2T1M0B4_9CHRO|nr:hormogonium polysaccharide biosynthesis protein HpsL [Aphanothece hegewaldii]PSF38090.1 hypothetical protein C7H19_06355 [Aphanothece hegewaldii CCALA 016]
MLKRTIKTQKESTKKETTKLSLQEQLARKRQAKENQKKLITVSSSAIAAGLVIGLPIALLAKPVYGLITALVIPILILSFFYPRAALWMFLIYIPFNGTITYWVSGENPILQVSKDIFYLPALLGLIFECVRDKKPILVPRKLMPTLAFLLFYCLLVLFVVNLSRETLPFCDTLTEKFLPNPQGGLPIRVPCKEGSPFLQGLLGLKVLMGYIPLIFCAYYFVDSKQKLLNIGRLLVILAIICCSLALVQYWLLYTGRCIGTRGMMGEDLFQAQIASRCFIGGAVLFSPEYNQIRLPGTFASPWHWGWFLVANSAICFASAFSEKAFWWKITGLAGLALVFINAIICGQRLSFLLVPIIIVVLLILTGQLKQFKQLIVIGVILVIFLSIGFSFFNSEFIQQRVDSFVGRWNQSPPQEFIVKQVNFALSNQRGILGNGLGRGTSSARVFGPISFLETFHSKLIFELGMIGFIIYMIFLTHLLILAFLSYRSIRDPSLRSFASSFWIFLVIISYLPYWYPLDTDPVGIYYWFFAGIIFKLPIIDKQEQQLKENPPLTLAETLKIKRKKLSWA